MEHHHHVEETVFYPALQKVEGVPKELFNTPLSQHVVLHEGLVNLIKYASATSKQLAEYRWETLKGMIEAFAPDLIKHLNEEIEVLLGLEKFDSDAVGKCFEATEKAAINDVSLNLLQDVFPVILGASDRTYEGENSW